MIQLSLSANPLPRTRYTTGRCWVEIEGHLAAVQHHDGGWCVQRGPNTTVHAVSGNAVWNHNASEIHDEPPHVDVQDRVLSVPVTLVNAGDVLIVIAKTTQPGSRGTLPYPPGRSKVSEMMPVVFVDWMPSPAYLRPPALGTGPLANFLRSTPIPISALRLDSLPSVIDIDSLPVDWSTWNHAKPTIATAEQIYGRFCGEVYSGWHTDEFTPDWQNVGYGREQASWASKASILLCSTAPPAAKATLARNMAQWGLDLYGAFIEGRKQQANGGHGNGRKALMIWLGHMLGLDALCKPNELPFIGRAFAEDFQYSKIGGVPRWRYNSTGDNSADWVKDPSQWPSGLRWEVQSYCQHCCGSQIGSALAMGLIGRRREFGDDISTVIEWFMGQPVAGVPIQFGADYSANGGEGFQSAAWQKYQHLRQP